jgi:hypothetical protein
MPEGSRLSSTDPKISWSPRQTAGARSASRTDQATVGTSMSTTSQDPNIVVAYPPT